jgi:hypothetical protein
VAVVGVAPQPGRQCLLLVRRRPAAGDAFEDRCLRGEQPVERRTGQLAEVPRVVGRYLRIADLCGAGAAWVRSKKNSSRVVRCAITTGALDGSGDGDRLSLPAGRARDN